MVVICGQTILQCWAKMPSRGGCFWYYSANCKHSYLVKNPHDVPRIVKESFHIATTGRPGAVVIDMPKDVSSSECDVAFEDAQMDLPGYVSVPEYDLSNIDQMAKLINVSEKPLLLVGHGAVISKARNEIVTLAETLNAPVVTTKLGKGIIPETHKLSLGMLGMHGTVVANRAVAGCDYFRLVVVGMIVL